MSTFEVNADSTAAKLVRFSTGKLNPNAKDRLKFKCFRKRESENKDPEMIVTTELNGIPFCGRNYGANNLFETDSCDYYIAIRKRGSDKMKVIPAQLFQLEPQFAEKSKALETNEDNATYGEKKYNLIKQFGSGKMQRRVNKHLKEKLDDDVITQTMESAIKNVSSEVLKSGSSHKKTTESESAQSAGPEASFLPPHDRNAASLNDIYKLDDIVPPDIRGLLTSVVTELSECTESDIASWRADKKYFEIVLKAQEMMLPEGEDAKLLRCQCLMYLQYLMYLYTLKSDRIRVKFPLPAAWNVRVKNHLLEKFTLPTAGSSKRLIPSRIKDLQLSYILVLCLRLCSYQVNLKCIAMDLNLPIKKLQIHANALGCKVTTKDESCTAVLNFPVKFPGVTGKRAVKRIF